MGLTTEEKLAIERKFADNRLRYADNQTRLKWEATASGHRFMAYKGKKIVAFNLMFGKPSVLRELTMKDLSLDFSNGLSSTWVDQDSKPVVITHTPYEIAEGCFLWHYKLSVLEYTEHFGDYAMRLAMTWRTRFNPRNMIDGHVYLLESQTFEAFEQGKLHYE